MYRRLQRGGILAVDCHPTAEGLWVGILALDPDKIRLGDSYRIIDPDNPGVGLDVIIDVDHTPAFRSVLKWTYPLK